MKLERYGFIGDLHTGALVSEAGAIDWLCLPRFDSDACFAALLGSPENGQWQIAPATPVVAVRQRYRAETLVLETEFETADGAVRVVDCMPPADGRHDIVRVVEGVRGGVPMEMNLAIRFNYGRAMPWVRRDADVIDAIAGPDALALRSDIRVDGDDPALSARWLARPGERQRFVLTWHRSHEPAPPPLDSDDAVRRAESFWRAWCGRCAYRGEWREAVLRSLMTLKALTFQPTGGVVAAATSSLPEKLGGVRNWDYRYCWLRDATFTFYALMESGYADEAQAWCDWLLRAVAGGAEELQMLYGVAGERRLVEVELPELAGYEGARPVRLGNAAAQQFQLDVYGEIMDVMHIRRRIGLPVQEDAWRLQRKLVDFVVEHWREPDEGIWEIRGGRRQLTHSKVMSWVALDRGVRAAERFGLPGDVERWRSVREEIHAEVCRRGYHAGRGTFTQDYGSDRLDAALLMMPLVGFLPMSDPRVSRTVAAIQRELTRDGLVHRYRPDISSDVDGLPPGEGTFLPCSFWLVECLALAGRTGEARQLFEHLLALRTPLGLLAEEYDADARRLVGNFPQAFSHVALVNAARSLEGAGRAAPHRYEP